MLDDAPPSLYAARVTDSADLSRRLSSALGLAAPPIAVTFADAVPDGVSRFEGSVPGGCSFWDLAARGPLATVTADHELCSIGVHTHNLAGRSANQPDELGTTLGVMAQLDYVRAEDVASIPVMPEQRACVVYAPLAEAPLLPDAVLVFADARQGLVVTEAVQQVDDGVPPALGRPACAVVPQAINSGRAALSLGCCGARAYLDGLTDDVALWALPGSRLADYVARIEALASANATLAAFHARRRADVEAGERPSVATSLERM